MCCLSRFMKGQRRAIELVKSSRRIGVKQCGQPTHLLARVRFDVITPAWRSVGRRRVSRQGKSPTTRTSEGREFGALRFYWPHRDSFSGTSRNQRRSRSRISTMEFVLFYCVLSILSVLCSMIAFRIIVFCKRIKSNTCSVIPKSSITIIAIDFD